MRIQHAIVPAVMLLASACASTPPRTELAPKLGPRGSIRALYDGGLLRRRVSAQFSVEQSAYVLVGHLGGDGFIRVVYPSRAYNTWGDKGQFYRTAAFAADYDAAPGYYFMTTTNMRSPGARTYSYDGRGHGFIFMITSRRPLRVDRISDFGVWDDMEVEDYHRMLDPRRAIREYADLLANGEAYSIQYAQSFTAYSYTTYADAMMDCAMFSSWAGPWSSGYGWAYNLMSVGVGPSWWMSPMRSGQYSYCGNSAYSYAFGYPFARGWNPSRPVTSTTPTYPPPTTEPIPQRSPRPTFTPTTPTERRTPARREGLTPPARRGDVLSHRPTWSENPTFAPAPTERRASPRRPNDFPTRTVDRSSTEPRRTNPGPRASPNNGSGSGSTGTSTPAASPSSKPAATPTMSPGHGGEPPAPKRPPPQ